MKIGLVNFNKRGVTEPDIPPVPPIGLEYLVGDLQYNGYHTELLDLCFVPSNERDKEIRKFIQDKDVIGITFRNIDLGCFLLIDHFFVPELKSIVGVIKKTKNIPVVLGGPGFSGVSEEILCFVGADFGIAGPGEIAFCDLLQNLNNVPHGTVIRGQPNTNIVHQRTAIDFKKYVAAGGAPAIQTKSGCRLNCSFCIEAKKPLNIRHTDAVIDELKILLSRGFQFIYVADSEFNTDIKQAEKFCDRIIGEGLGFNWSSYLSPKPLTRSLVKKLKAAGCVNPCIGIDSGDDAVINALNKNYNVEYILEMASWFHEVNFPFTVDLIFGSVNDNFNAAKRTIDLMEKIKPKIVGMNFGVRVYKNTLIWRQIVSGKIPIESKLYGHLEDNHDLIWPIFYIYDMDVLDYLKQVCDRDGKYKLFGYKSFEGVNYTIAG
jgi:radical SAM superfamily enzyme YgiQ (UPF0313 family)